ncbi:ankyrin repeat domain-containing protein 50 [Coprinopsis cinerea AmutBmut pab1-1]|nr:ankyrin repeat domain-containing protein 50 [Coprinopsis cinerea AmutBmut pab1-1]
MGIAGKDASYLAALNAGGTVPSVNVGEGSAITGGTVIGGDYHNVTHIHSISASAEPRGDSSESRDALISDITTWFDLRSNSRGIHIDVRKKRIPATGDWFINSKEYTHWKGTKGAVLCGTGIPGAGKTVLMSRVVDDLLPLEEAADRKICVLFVYNRYNEPLSVGDILKNFILQIIQRHRHLADLVKPLYRRGRLEKTNPSDDDLLNLLLRLEGHFDRTFYVIDGVDEVDRKHQFDLIQFLNQLQGNVIFASRPLDDLRTELEGARYLTLLAKGEDLQLLIDDRLRRYKALCRVLEKNNYREEATRQIAEKAEGMFLHAALQIEALRNCLSLSAVEAKLEQFPVGIEGMYAASISRIESQDPELVRIAKQVLFWLVFSRGPLSLRDLQSALGVNPQTYSVEKSLMPDEESIIDLCCGLVELDTESDVVRLVHFTARDALQPILLKDFPGPHLFISKVLAQKMVDKGLPCCTIAEIEAFDTLIEQEPLLRYSYEHWGTHVLECGDTPEANEVAMAFLRQCTSFPSDHTWHSLVPLKPLHVAAFYGLSIYLDHAFGNNGDCDGRPTPCLTSADSSPQAGDKPIGSAPIDGSRMLCSGALIIASTMDHVDFVKRILQMSDIDVNAVDNVGWTALQRASLLGHEDVVNELLQFHGIDVNATNSNGWTAFMIAAFVGHERIVNRLLQVYDIDINAVANEDATALTFASDQGHDGAVGQLLQFHGIDINAVDTRGATALMCAADQGHDGVVSQILQREDLNVNAQSDSGWTALMCASDGGRDGVVSQLLQRQDLNVNAQNDSGWTALMCASDRGHAGVVSRLMLRDDLHVDAQSDSGWTALMCASDGGHDEVVGRLMQRRDLNVNAQNDSGWTALMWASDGGHDGVISQLLQREDLNPNARSDSGWTALMWAAYKGHDGAVSRLLQRRDVDVNAQSDSGRNALMCATDQGHYGVVRQLLRFHGIDVNAVDGSGVTALILASNRGRGEVVNQLLRYPGIDVDFATGSGKTALSIAQERGRSSVVALLTRFIQNRSAGTGV